MNKEIENPICPFCKTGMTILCKFLPGGKWFNCWNCNCNRDDIFNLYVTSDENKIKEVFLETAA